VYAIQGTGPFWGPERGYKRGNFGYMIDIPLTNHYGTNALIFGMMCYLGTRTFKFVQINSWGHKWPCPKRT